MTDHRGSNDSVASRARAVLIALALTGAAMGTAAPQLGAQQTGDGFLFHRSYGQLFLHGGFAQARTHSRVFEFTTEQLTVDRGDFSSFEGGMEMSGALSSRFAITLGFDYSRASRPSEFREWVDNDDQPIEQTTTFTRVPVMLGMKAYIIPPGQSVGLLAWVPNRIAPYVGGGIGMIRYNFSQQGDWVDFQDLSVFTDKFQSSGSAALSYISAGVDVSLHPRFGITTEVRSVWARGEHTDDFIGFDRIDLSGTTLKAGLFIRF